MATLELKLMTAPLSGHLLGTLTDAGTLAGSHACPPFLARMTSITPVGHRPESHHMTSPNSRYMSDVDEQMGSLESTTFLPHR